MHSPKARLITPVGLRPGGEASESVRRRLNRPMTLSEKIPPGHLDDPETQELTPGRVT